jgi:hypothetical protein
MAEITTLAEPSLQRLQLFIHIGGAYENWYGQCKKECTPVAAEFIRRGKLWRVQIYLCQMIGKLFWEMRDLSTQLRKISDRHQGLNRRLSH